MISTLCIVLFHTLGIMNFYFSTMLWHKSQGKVYYQRLLHLQRDFTKYLGHCKLPQLPSIFLIANLFNWLRRSLLSYWCYIYSLSISPPSPHYPGYRMKACILENTMNNQLLNPLTKSLWKLWNWKIFYRWENLPNLNFRESNPFVFQ